jgi:hypothetical protein
VAAAAAPEAVATGMKVEVIARPATTMVVVLRRVPMGPQSSDGGQSTRTAVPVVPGSSPYAIVTNPATRDSSRSMPMCH